jgi:hypothetical protein
VGPGVWKQESAGLVEEAAGLSSEIAHFLKR